MPIVQRRAQEKVRIGRYFVQGQRVLQERQSRHDVVDDAGDFARFGFLRRRIAGRYSRIFGRFGSKTCSAGASADTGQIHPGKLSHRALPGAMAGS